MALCKFSTLAKQQLKTKTHEYFPEQLRAARNARKHSHSFKIENTASQFQWLAIVLRQFAFTLINMTMTFIKWKCFIELEKSFRLAWHLFVVYQPPQPPLDLTPPMHLPFAARIYRRDPLVHCFAALYQIFDKMGILLDAWYVLIYIYSYWYMQYIKFLSYIWYVFDIHSLDYEQMIEKYNGQIVFSLRPIKTYRSRLRVDHCLANILRKFSKYYVCCRNSQNIMCFVKILKILSILSKFSKYYVCCANSQNIMCVGQIFKYSVCCANSQNIVCVVQIFKILCVLRKFLKYCVLRKFSKYYVFCANFQNIVCVVQILKILCMLCKFSKYYVCFVQILKILCVLCKFLLCVLYKETG